MGQSSGVLFKEVSAFQRCPLIEVFLYMVASTVEPLYSGHLNWDQKGLF